MASLFDDPYKMQFLNRMGVGLLQASQPAPSGFNRMSYVSNALSAANENMRQSQLFDMKKQDYEERRAEKAARKEAAERLGGGLESNAWAAHQGLGTAGLDPATGIDWESARQPSLMDDNQAMSLMAQANPDMFTELMMRRQFATPAEPTLVKDAAGYQRYATGPDKGQRVFPDAQKTNDSTYTYGNFLPKGGTETMVGRRPSKGGPIEIDDGTEWKRAPQGSFIGQNVEAGSIGGLGPQKKEGVTLREQRDIMTNLIKQGNRLRGDLKVSGAKAVGWTGAIERFSSTAVAQGKALASRYNDGGMVDEIAQSIEWSPELAAQSAAVRSQISSMAYGIALMKNGTRPTDEDVRHAMIMMGKSGDPDQMLGAIDSLMRESVDNYATRHKTITGNDWDAPEHFRSYRVPVPGSDKPAKLDYIDMDDQGLKDFDLNQLKTIEEIKAWRAEMKKRGFSGG